MSGVVVPFHSKAQHDVVGGTLGLAMQLTLRQPEERMKPIDRAEAFRGYVTQPVSPANVCELVAEDRAEPLVAPRRRIGGQQHARTTHTPRDGNCQRARLQQLWPP